MSRILKKTLRKIKEPKVLVSLFIASIMVFSIMGFMMSYQMEDRAIELEYNGYEFEQLYDGIRTEINGETVTLNYFPEQLERFNLSEAIKITLQNMPVFSVTYEADSEYKEYFAAQQYNLNENLPKLDRYIIPGITNNTDVEHIPVITCLNATPSIPVIFFREANSTSIKFNNNCIIINIANMNDADQVGDLLFYYIAGIME